MAKQRLVDFRGGINQKISSHMIGDSQGQSAQDTDLSAVRLQGRKKLDDQAKAEGTFYYDTSSSSSRWVSTDSADGDAYIEHSSDFAVWNRDLYVAMGASNSSGTFHADGKIIRYLDGATAPVSVAINAPASATVSISDAGYATSLIAAISAGSSSGNVTGVVSTVASNSSLTPQRFIHTTYTQTYAPSGANEATAYGGRAIWTRSDTTTQYVVASGANDGVSGSITGDLLTFQGGSINANTNTNVSVTNAANFNMGSDGNNSSSRAFTATSDTRSGEDGSTYTKYTSTLGEGWASGGLLRNSSASATKPAFNSTASVSDLSNLYPAFTAGTAYTDGGNNLSFTPYSNSNTTVYAPSSSGGGLTANQLYQRTGSSSAAETPTASSSGWVWIKKFTNLYNTTSGSSQNVWITLDSTYKSYEIIYNGVQVATSQATNAHLIGDVIPGTGTYQGYLFKRSILKSTSGNFKYYEIQVYDTTDLGWLYIVWNGNAILSPNFNTPSSATYSIDTSTYSTSTHTYTRDSTIQNDRYNDSLSASSGVLTQQDREVTRQAVSNFSYSAYTHTQTAAYSFTGTVQATLYTVTPRTYLLHQLATPYQSGTTGTPAFTYDIARSKIYEQNKEHAELTSDNSFSTNWLTANQDFIDSTHGYFVQSVIASSNLPQISNTSTRAVPPATSILGSTSLAKHTPLRLDLSLTPDSSTTTVAYRLTRKDNTYETDLGYVLPDSGISFSYSASNKTISISGLANSTVYKLKFQAYQDSVVQVGSASFTKTNIDGAEFTSTSSGGHPTIVLGTVANGDSRFFAADFWLKKQVLTGASAAGDETYAVVRCFDVLHDSTTGTVTSGSSDFLDGFTTTVAGLGLGISAGNNTATDAPAYLKFLLESNNFFFGVGTANTEAAKYGGTNKKGSFLFVSAYNDPTNWPTAAYVRFDKEITGLASYPGEVIVFTDNSVYRVTGSRSDQMRKTKLATTEGLPEGNSRTIALVNKYLCWLSESGICFYDGSAVTNLSRGRFESLTFNAANFMGEQFDDAYYVVDDSERGYTVDFSQEGFPITEVNLLEASQTTNISQYTTETSPAPVLHYVGSQNKLYTRKGVVEGNSSRNAFSYKTRAFDGGGIGSLKYIKNVGINGSGSGRLRISIDGSPVSSTTVTDYSGLTSVPVWNATGSSAIGTTLYYDNVLLNASVNTKAGAYFQLHLHYNNAVYQTSWGGAYPLNNGWMNSHAMLFVPDFGGTTYGWDSTNDVAKVYFFRQDGSVAQNTDDTSAIDNSFLQRIVDLTTTNNSFSISQVWADAGVSDAYYSGFSAANQQIVAEYLLSKLSNQVFYAEITNSGTQHPFLFKITGLDLSARTILTSYPYGTLSQRTNPYLSNGIYKINSPTPSYSANWSVIVSFTVGYLPYYTLENLPSDRILVGDLVSVDVSGVGNPTRIYLPASQSNIYGLPVGDSWSIEINNWNGHIDWIDTEYEILSD